MSIRSKIIYVDAFDFAFTALLADDIKEVLDKYELGGEGEAVVFPKTIRGKKRLFVAFHTDATFGHIAHETVHLVNHLFKSRGIEPDVDNDETQAYLTGFIAGKLHNFIYYNHPDNAIKQDNKKSV